MKIGIFDSGLGGLIIAKAIIKKLPQYNYVYLGDTKNLPYGEKSAGQIFNYTRSAVDFLFKLDCEIIIVACNTSSALALRKIQKEYLPKKYPDRRILGVVIPTLEEAAQIHLHNRSLIRANKRTRIGVIGTRATISSHIYKKELEKIDRHAKIYELATPKLVELIEKNALPKAKNALELYLKTLQKQGIEALILGCTHYPILKREVKGIMGKNVSIISQDEIIPAKLADYLKRHRDIEKTLSRNGKKEFLVTKMNTGFKAVAKRLFTKKIKLRFVKIT